MSVCLLPSSLRTVAATAGKGVASGRGERSGTGQLVAARFAVICFKSSCLFPADQVTLGGFDWLGELNPFLLRLGKSPGKHETNWGEVEWMAQASQLVGDLPQGFIPTGGFVHPHRPVLS